MARLRTCSRLRMLISHSTDREALKSVAWGLVWVMGAVWFWLHLAGSPIDDFRLMLYATAAQGQIVETWEDVGDRDDGGVDWFYSIAYTFKLPNGREVRSFSKGSGRLSAELADLKSPVPVEVEYVPTHPSVNRLKGDGSQSLVGWLLRTSLGVLLLVLFLAPGVRLIRDGLSTLRAGSPTPSKPPQRLP